MRQLQGSNKIAAIVYKHHEKTGICKWLWHEKTNTYMRLSHEKTNELGVDLRAVFHTAPPRIFVCALPLKYAKQPRFCGGVTVSTMLLCEQPFDCHFEGEGQGKYSFEWPYFESKERAGTLLSLMGVDVLDLIE